MNCAGVALTNGRRVFLIRPFYDGNAQSMAIPKGHVERFEGFREAALREFREETGIDLRGKPMRELTCVYTRINDGMVKKVTVFEVFGNGKERFKGSCCTRNGFPEAICGEYVPFDIARRFITGYQVPIVDKLMEDDTSSLVNFYIKRTNRDA